MKVTFLNMRIINLLQSNLRLSCYSEHDAVLLTEFAKRFNGCKICEIKYAVATVRYNFGVDKAKIYN
jgi:hypothetical protein